MVIYSQIQTVNLKGVSLMLYEQESSKSQYLIHVLERDNVSYVVTGDGTFVLPDDVDLTEMTEDILCEEQRQSTESKIPVYSKKTLENKEKLERLQEYYGRKGFHVLKKDQEACKAA